VAASALALAALTWGLVWVWQFRRSAVQRHIEAGIEAAQSGQGEKAEQEWQTAVRLDPRNAGAWDLLGEYYLSTNNQPAAVAAFRRALQLQPHTSKREGQLAESTLRAGDEVSALRYAQDALKDDPDNAAALSIAARLLGDVQDEKRRIDCLRRLVKIQPDDLSALSRLAVALSDNQLHPQAGPVLAHILDLDPNNATAHALRGEMHFILDASPQGLAQAQSDLNRALQLDPTAPFPRFYLGKLYLRTGQPARAVFQLEEAARLQPDKPEIYFELADAYRRAGKPQQAGAARRRFAALSDHADLVSRLEKRCVVEPQNFAIHAQLGLLKLKEGDYRRAGFYLNAAHQLQPTDTRVDAALRQIAALSSP
jgi:cytochrome c-type biogenesis protein CcmH/NrfG